MNNAELHRSYKIDHESCKISILNAMKMVHKT